MDLGRLIDAMIEPFAPASVRRRMAERMALQQIRQYDAAGHGRRTQGWQRPGTSANAETRRGRVGLRNGARELVRNNPYAAAALQQMTAHVIGDGIDAIAAHPDPEIQKRAQDRWLTFAHSKVDGWSDFYGVQKLAFRGAAEGGDTFVAWEPDDVGPDGRCRVLEGDFLDHWRFVLKPGAGRIEQGIEFDARGDRTAYWLFDLHPGDFGGASGMGGGFGYGGVASRYDAAHIDHVFERLRAGQVTGVSWFAPVMMKLRDLGDYEDAVLMKKKVEACLALVLTPPEGNGPPGPFDGAPAAGEAQSEPQGTPDRLRPGMILRARPGETATAVNPSSTGQDIGYIVQQLDGIAANLVPSHLMTGNVSRANYSSLRAAMLGFWANLDDWQQNMMIPLVCKPAFDRQMRRLALATGDKRFLQVTAQWSVPVRRFVDPIKDLMGEIAEIRAGLKSMVRALTERGLDPAQHLQLIADFNALSDQLKLAFDTDPRRLTEGGILQAPAAFLFGANGNPGN